ncbi:PREDICTED: uncharacterized protein LOC109224130 [Nicotiana attenuata]|uniref:KIB1-4 beta-propeller domain-containing protein n=1 Tax=Nicotiana attenuata TaxID=49451 RepID=A0A1J6IH94_NICAT|nr:PREDICTED: uncharacterized protein LOC109224130 [Nicotiana attenuata]OIT04254.1 hypothetical protein A4A49_01578 [Nicotiana attenuata]
MGSKLILRDWTGLSDLVLDLIFQKLPSCSDCLCFGAVCKSWLFFVSNNYDALQQRGDTNSIAELPLLMIFKGPIGDMPAINTSLYSVTKGKIVLDLEIPLRYWTHECVGSSHGWLAFQAPNSFVLFNPFTHEKINLPPLEFDAHKVILSKNPSTSTYDYEVAAMSTSWTEDKVAILKPGRKTWIPIHGIIRGCNDMIYYDDRYYIVTYYGKVLSIDNTTLKYKEIAPPSTYKEFKEFYLVKTTTNELLRVEILRPHAKPTSVKIWKLVARPTTQQSMFVELDNLGDEVLFLSQHCSISVLASKFSGCKANSIFYMYRYGSPCKPWMFCVDFIHLQDGTFNTHFSFNTQTHDKYHTMPPALWIVPTPKFNT